VSVESARRQRGEGAPISASPAPRRGAALQGKRPRQLAPQEKSASAVAAAANGPREQVGRRLAVLDSGDKLKRQAEGGRAGEIERNEGREWTGEGGVGKR
jgi:hypothetical protein